MTNAVMTYHESYGEIPRALLSLFRVRKVSPGDFYMMEEFIGIHEFARFYDHVEANSSAGFYRAPFPFRP